MTTQAPETLEAGLRYIATQDASVSADGLQSLARHFLAIADKPVPPRVVPLIVPARRFYDTPSASGTTGTSLWAPNVRYLP